MVSLVEDSVSLVDDSVLLEVALSLVLVHVSDCDVVTLAELELSVQVVRLWVSLIELVDCSRLRFPASGWLFHFRSKQ